MISIYSNKAKKGRKIVVLVIGLVLTYYYLGFFLNMKIDYSQVFSRQTIELLVITIISILFYKGFRFAEWIIFSLSVRPVLSGIFYGLNLLGIVDLYNGWLMLITAVIAGVIGGLLLGRTESMDFFMKEQRAKRKWLKRR